METTYTHQNEQLGGTDATKTCTFVQWMLPQPDAVRGNEKHQDSMLFPNSKERWPKKEPLRAETSTFRNLWSGERQPGWWGRGLGWGLGDRTNTSFVDLAGAERQPGLDESS